MHGTAAGLCMHTRTVCPRTHLHGGSCVSPRACWPPNCAFVHACPHARPPARPPARTHAHTHTRTHACIRRGAHARAPPIRQALHACKRVCKRSNVEPSRTRVWGVGSWVSKHAPRSSARCNGLGQDHIYVVAHHFVHMRTCPRATFSLSLPCPQAEAPCPCCANECCGRLRA